MSKRDNIFWIVGGSGSGKTTICQTLSAKFDVPVYDMDAHIYGRYHNRFTPELHPVNSDWASAQDGFAWLLNMSWKEFDSFNRAALPEYLNLLCEDLNAGKAGTLIIDGGIFNPALLAQVFPAKQIVCLARPGRSSKEIWEETAARLGMKEFIYQLPDPDAAWRRFLEFDAQITRTIYEECQQNQIAVCLRSETDSVDEFAERVRRTLGIG
ncbi:MAG: hypothetical protein GY805_35735 [Chloroflexi bacterium]|nr:hypothetical protein [Chloroflexota bacterium]